jgi:hypothetical protein
LTLPKRALTRSGYGGRGYRPLGHKNLPVLPSVTTILKAESKDALTQWSADQTAAFAIAQGERLLSMADAKAWGFLRFYWKRSPKDPLSGDVDLNDYHTGVLSDAGELGDSVHEWIEADLFGLPFPDVRNRNSAFRDCVGQWNKFKSEHTIVPHRVENTVWNNSGDGLGYAGTFDLLCEIDGELYLLDIKTSRGLYSSTWMQLAALFHAPTLLEEGENGVDRFIHDWQKPIKRLAVIHVRPDDDDREAFCKLVEMPGDHNTHFKSFLGLRQYIEAQRELTEAAKK